jgi:glycosyltransferase involved in cell wall biosynthesis
MQSVAKPLCAGIDLRICLVTEDFFPDDGAVAILLSQLVRYLCDTYSDVTIDIVTSMHLSTRMGVTLPPYTSWDGIDIWRVDARRSKRPSVVLRLFSGAVFAWRALRLVEVLHRRRRYDLLFVGTNPPSLPIVGQRMLRKAGIPYLYLVHDLFPDIAVGMGALRVSGLPTLLARRLQKKWLSAARAVVVVGRCMRLAVVASYGLPAGACQVIPNWSDVDAIRPLSVDTAFRTANHLSGFLVIYSGNLGRAQKLHTVLKAAQILRDTYPDIGFVLVGNGSARQELSRHIEEMGLKNVRVLPSVPRAQYADLLASADVSLVSLDSALVGLAVPSKIYNMLASGRPIITVGSRESEIAMLVLEHQCGLQVDHNDGAQLAEAVVALYLGGSALRDRLGQMARTACTDLYALQIIGDKYYRLIQEIVSSSDVQI